MTSTILVTGATGNVGKEVVRLLSTQDCHVLAATRNPIAAQQNFPNNVRCIEFDFTKPDTFTDAFAGVKRLFLVRPPAIADLRNIEPALEKAKQVGIEQIVFLSILGAEQNKFLPHTKIEALLDRLAIPSVFLRASFFMQNLNNTHREDIRLRDRLFMPAGNGKTSFIDVRDIAAVAAKVLIEPIPPERVNRAYDLTGSVALTYDEVATIFTAVLGRSIVYTHPSIPRFVWEMSQQGFPLPFVLIMVVIYTTARLGLAAAVTADVEQLLERPPITIQQYIEDYRNCWL
jgi:uncharacterized protein YbjT (DUF2867 family)